MKIFNLGKQKYKAIFLIKEYGTINKIKKKTFNPLIPIIRYKKKSYAPIINQPTYREKNKLFYFFEINGKQITIKHDNNDIEVGVQLNTVENDNDKESTVKDLLYIQEVIKQVFMALGKVKFILNWLHLALAIGFSVVVGWIIGTYVPISLAGV